MNIDINVQKSLIEYEMNNIYENVYLENKYIFEKNELSNMIYESLNRVNEKNKTIEYISTEKYKNKNSKIWHNEDYYWYYFGFNDAINETRNIIKIYIPVRKSKLEYHTFFQELYHKNKELKFLYKISKFKRRENLILWCYKNDIDFILNQFENSFEKDYSQSNISLFTPLYKGKYGITREFWLFPKKVDKGMIKMLK
ncbi:hypothetical protein SAMN02745164_02185 [Marinitoga hydrogenitolerans DSM 16785]|uniref:Uncharacterized protein n=1 Tax=Marinitoga hydrogenitolerans (strain DSM 16785 / JCM 12826 / AT1271) TaxID=1122195 RepID=A0A1M5AH02_MARH1|nr:hypothetical protein [Marinitoga hydrogenitolerans]SHF29417.1 hypothetical protein SAMN02745164_02185 [Marinitoga hydrogenitolerans DSM 16785]